MRQVHVGEHSFRHCRYGRSATSPQALLLAERIVCNKTKAIGARRCNTILINAGVDPSQNSQRAERTLAAAKSPAHESLCAPVLFSAALNRWLAVVRRISHFVARLTELREADRPMAR
jgi:2-iminoacetate synthase ThiH